MIHAEPAVRAVVEQAGTGSDHPEKEKGGHGIGRQFGYAGDTGQDRGGDVHRAISRRSLQGRFAAGTF